MKLNIGYEVQMVISLVSGLIFRWLFDQKATVLTETVSRLEIRWRRM